MERGPSSIPGSNTALSFSRYYANLNSIGHTQTIKSEASSSYLMLFLILLFEPVFIYQWLQLPILRLPAEAIAWLTPSVLEVLSTTDLKHRGLVLKFHSGAFCPHPGQSSGTWPQTVAKIFLPCSMPPPPHLVHTRYCSCRPLCRAPPLLSLQWLLATAPPRLQVFAKRLFYIVLSAQPSVVGCFHIPELQWEKLGGQFLWEPVWLSDSYRTQTAPDPDQTGYRRTG